MRTFLTLWKMILVIFHIKYPCQGVQQMQILDVFNFGLQNLHLFLVQSCKFVDDKFARATCKLQTEEGKKLQICIPLPLASQGPFQNKKPTQIWNSPKSRLPPLPPNKSGIHFFGDSRFQNIPPPSFFLELKIFSQFQIPHGDYPPLNMELVYC